MRGCFDNAALMELRKRWLIGMPGSCDTFRNTARSLRLIVDLRDVRRTSTAGEAMQIQMMASRLSTTYSNRC